MSYLAKNKKALFDYEILEQFEAGIILSGAEVKSCRQSRVNLKGSYLTARQIPATKDSRPKNRYAGNQPAIERIFIEKMHISPYQAKNQPDYDPYRPRQLLLHKKEIKKISEKISEKGITAIPLELISKNQLIKVKIGLCRGKKKYDKREDLKKKAISRDIKKALKKF